MDAGTAAILGAFIGLAGSVVAAIVAVTAVRITASAGQDLERMKWRRELYAALLHSSDRVRGSIRIAVEGGPLDDGWARSLGDASRSYWEIRIVAPDVATAAGALKDAADHLMRGVFRVDQAALMDGGFRQVPIDRTRYPALDEAYRVAMLEFIEAAASDVGGKKRRFLRRN